jgi:hypothetical protein
MRGLSDINTPPNDCGDPNGGREKKGDGRKYFRSSYKMRGKLSNRRAA